MQFAYKSQHSTALCSVVYLETLQYNRQHGSQVYSCLLDASKAFDRIHYGKLFNILISRKLPAFIIRVLFDSYKLTVDNNLELCGTHVILNISTCQTG